MKTIDITNMVTAFMGGLLLLLVVLLTAQPSNWSVGNKPMFQKPTAEKQWHFTTESHREVTTISQLATPLAEKFGDRVYPIAFKVSKETEGGVYPSAAMVLAIAATESSFRTDAESSSSVGLLQINAKAHGLSKKDMFDVDKNIKHSVSYLRKLNKTCKGNQKCVILSYNVGHKAYTEGRYNIAYYNKVINYLNM